MGKIIQGEINGTVLTMETEPGVFSPENFDKGTLAMLSCLEFGENEKLLDLGCGYGLVGVYAAKKIGQDNVIMTDIDFKSITLSRRNAERNGVPDVRIFQSDGFSSLDEAGFSFILSNPPYHTDFSVAKHFIEKGFNRLKIGGKLLMVTKRLDWYKNKITAVFGGVRVMEIDGYYVFIGEKRQSNRAKVKPKKRT